MPKLDVTYIILPFITTVTAVQRFGNVTSGPVQLIILTWLPWGWELAPPTAPTQSAAPADGPWLVPQSCEGPSPRPGLSASSWCPDRGFLAGCWLAARPPASAPAPVSLSARAAEAAPRPGPDSHPAGPAAPAGSVIHQRGDVHCAAGSHPPGSTGPGRSRLNTFSDRYLTTGIRLYLKTGKNSVT